MRVEKYPIRIIEGNSFTLSIELQQIAWGHGTGTTSEFVPLESDRIRVWLVSKAGERIEAFNAVVSANELLISFDEGICKGLYDIEIFVYRANGTRLHCRLEKRIHIVPTTDKMGIEVDTIKLTGAVLLVIDGVSLQWDDTPTEGSGAVVTSDGIYHALQELREDFDNAKIEVDEELDGTSANPVQNKAITEAIEGIEDDLQTLQSNSVNVEVDAQSREFAITNANGVKIGTIKVGTGISGVATLAFKDKAGHEINVTLPNLAYNENTQYLEYIDAIGAHHNTIKLSNLQIKGVFSETPSMGDWALGDLILVGADSSYELNVFDGTNWQSLGSINNVSLQADQVSFSAAGFNATNTKDAIVEVDNGIRGKQLYIPNEADNRYLQANGNWAASNYSVLLNVSDFRGNDVVVNKILKYAFLTDSNASSATFCDGESITDYVTMSKLTIPNDANYLYLYIGSNLPTYMPVVCIEGESDGIEDRLESLESEMFSLIGNEAEVTSIEDRYIVGDTGIWNNAGSSYHTVLVDVSKHRGNRIKTNIGIKYAFLSADNGNVVTYCKGSSDEDLRGDVTLNTYYTIPDDAIEFYVYYSGDIVPIFTFETLEIKGVNEKIDELNNEVSSIKNDVETLNTTVFGKHLTVQTQADNKYLMNSSGNYVWRNSNYSMLVNVSDFKAETIAVSNCNGYGFLSDSNSSFGTLCDGCQMIPSTNTEAINALKDGLVIPNDAKYLYIYISNNEPSALPNVTVSGDTTGITEDIDEIKENLEEIEGRVLKVPSEADNMYCRISDGKWISDYYSVLIDVSKFKGQTIQASAGNQYAFLVSDGGHTAGGYVTFCKDEHDADIKDISFDRNTPYTIPDDANYFYLYLNTNPSSVPTITVTGEEYGVDYLLDNFDAIAAPSNIVKGKKIAWFGDSLSQLKQLPHLVEKRIGQTIYDCSFAGAPIYGLGNSNDNYYDTGFCSLISQIVANNFTPLQTALDNQLSQGQITQNSYDAKMINKNTLASIDFTEIDKIVVFAGTNDKVYATTSVDGLKNGLRTALQSLFTNKPNIIVYGILSPYRTDWDDTSGGTKRTLLQVNDAIAEIYEEFNIPYLDFFHNCCTNQYNYLQWMNTDGLHQNDAGDKMWADKLSAWLLSV